MVAKLIELGANVDARNNDLRTPLALACDEGSTKVVRLLVANDAAIGLVDLEGYVRVDSHLDHLG